MTYRFDEFLLHPATRELHRNGEIVALPARAFDCLAYLIEHRDRAVGRDELIAAVWGRTEISEALLSHTIVKLRRSLGDTGNEQRTIRTVPRFGYRWIAATTVETPSEPVPYEASADAGLQSKGASDSAIGDPIGDPMVDSIGDAATAAVGDGVPARSQRTRRRVLAIGAALVGFALAVSLLFVLLRAPAPQATTPMPVAAAGAADDSAASPVMVLPAVVDASDDWRWLRFGLMDLVANRLRSGAIATTPSEAVVGLLKRSKVEDGEAMLHDPALARLASLRVLPRVKRVQARWQVALEATGVQRNFSVEAEGDDAIGAGRAAADALLRKLGHAALITSETPLSPALDDLLQRSGAAMLADQLDRARALIANAPQELQQAPQLEQRMAQIELRAGEYAAVEKRLHALLDRLPAGRDDALRARVMLTLAAAFVRQNQPDKAFDLYEEAVALRSGQSDHEVLGIARLGRGSVLASRGRYDEAIAELSRARTELATVGDRLGMASVDVNLGEFQLARHRPADAITILERAVAQFEQLGAREGRVYALSEVVAAQFQLLDAKAALATSDRFWPAEDNTSNQRMRWTLTQVRAEALARVGRVDEAHALADHILAESDPRQDALVRSQAHLLDARLALQRGDAVSAAERVAKALTADLRDGDEAGWVSALLLQAEALRASGRLADAAAAVMALQAFAAERTSEWRSLYAALGSAEQVWSEGQREVALEKFAAAMQSAERLGVPEDLVAVGAPYLAALIEASQMDTARTVSGRIAMWADQDVRAATAQARLFRALGQADAAEKAEQVALRLNAGQETLPSPIR